MKLSTLQFAPQEGIIAKPEKEVRNEICLNGYWDFMKWDLPNEYREGTEAPDMGFPKNNNYIQKTLKVPSPWNINTFNFGEGGDFVSYPGYPAEWGEIKAAYLRKTISIPANWSGNAIKLHFSAIAGKATLFINKKEVAKHFDNTLPLTVDITEQAIPGESVEIVCAIQAPCLQNITGNYGAPYPAGAFTYPKGSFFLRHIAGIWQDVYLYSVPMCSVESVFVSSNIDNKTVTVETEIENKVSDGKKVELTHEIYKWQNLSDINDLYAGPVSNWKLGEKVICQGKSSLQVSGTSKKKEMVTIDTKDLLEKWEPETPALYAVITKIFADGKMIDLKYTRFGYRTVVLNGRDLLLNGKKIQLFADSWHFMGIPQLTRRYAWSWYKTAKEVNINTIRPHAMVYPAFYYDLADEMGMLILAENDIWATGGAYNYDCEITWKRFYEHTTNWVLRDRNHPSIIGWSIGNEVSGSMNRLRPTEEYRQNVYEKFSKMVNIVKENDGTRDWISSDGDFDMDGRLPVSVLHYNYPENYADFAKVEKPFGVGESGIGYYGRPPQAELYAGDNVYRSYEKRAEAVAIEAYELLKEQRKHCSYCSVFNVAWYGLRQLALGHEDLSLAPNLSSGVYFTHFEEGVPGVQPERLGPYTTTFNPGYDPDLPLYQAFPLYDAVKAVYAKGGPAESKWSSRVTTDKSSISSSITKTGYLSYSGDKSLGFNKFVTASGIVSDIESESNSILFDGESISEQSVLSKLKKCIAERDQKEKTILIMNITEDSIKVLNELLPLQLSLTKGVATSLVYPEHLNHPIAKVSLKEMYFAEDSGFKTIATDFINLKTAFQSQVILYAPAIDWCTWIDNPEARRTSAVIRNQNERKAGVVYITIAVGKLQIHLSTILLRDQERANSRIALVRRLLESMGFSLKELPKASVSAIDSDMQLIRSLTLGKVPTKSVPHGFELGITQIPIPGKPVESNEKYWTLAEANGKTFVLKEENFDTGYRNFYFELFSPRTLAEILDQPDMPVLGFEISTSIPFVLMLNGQEIERKEHLKNNEVLLVNNILLQKGWNQILIVCAHAFGATELALRLVCEDKEYLTSIESKWQLEE